MTKGELLRDRTMAEIVDSAATILGERGEAASMTEIATAAGVGRATLYRYFPNRDALLDAMAAASVEELAARIQEANLDSVPFDEAIARLARAIIGTGSKYIYLSIDGGKHSDSQPDFDAKVTQPIRALFHHAVLAGSLRKDLPMEILMTLFSGLIRGALETTATRRHGIEETAAAVTTLFLHGSRNT